MNLDNLPVEWSVSQLTKMIASEGLISDGDWIESKDQDEKGDIRLIQLADIGDGDFRDKSNRYMNQDAFDRLNCVELKANDVLIARMPDPLGRACIFPKLPYKCVTVVDVCLIRTGERSAISPKLLKYWINSTQIRNLIALNATGTTRKRITRKKLESFDFPVPPLAEQQEIVRQLGIMLAQVEQIKARLDAIPAILKKFRQSVLADAVSGKLTEKERGTTSIKSGIPAITLGKQYTESPKGWIWSNLTELAALESGHTPRKSVAEYWDGGDVPWISLQDIREAHGKVINDTKFMPTMKGIDNSSARLLPKGTVCFSRDISVGYTTIMGREMATTQHFANWVCNKELLNNFYLMYAYMASKDSLLLSGQGTTVKTIYMPALKTSMILLPPLEEQELIVTKIQNFFRMSELIESQISAVQKRVNVLTQSILAKAFSGELTAEWREQHQDLITGVNSAEALLAKIQEEWEASKPVKKTRKKKEV